MIWFVIAGVAFLLAAFIVQMFRTNERLFRLDVEDLCRLDVEDVDGIDDDRANWKVSVLIPARDEAAGIGRSVQAALASRNVDVEVVVMDDGSTDGTDQVVKGMAARDDRVVYCRSRALPPTWNGKQHACMQLAEVAKYDRISFIDADVRLHPSGLATLCRRQDRTEVALLSAFPRQEAGTFWEKLLIPLMHFILLGFLPFSRMRGSSHPAYAAGCGQWFLTHKADYEAAGTHAAIHQSRHDGVKLPRVYRSVGLMTDVVDGGKLATCRMYGSAAEVFRGVLKNAIEGIANPRLILPFTVMLIGGAVLPSCLVLIWLFGGMPRFGDYRDAVLVTLILAGFVLSFVPRALAAYRFDQSFLGVSFHPFSVLVFVLLQWIALLNYGLGRQVAWRGRVETA